MESFMGAEMPTGPAWNPRPGAISAQMSSSMGNALDLDQAVLNENAGNADLLFEMVDQHPVQLQMIDHAAFGTGRKARAVTNEASR